jgi:hypothetical protein
MNDRLETQLLTSHEDRWRGESGGSSVPTLVGLLMEYLCQNGTKSYIYDLSHVIGELKRGQLNLI